MAVRTRKPTTASNRHTSLLDNTWLSKNKPLKKLTKRVKYDAGRNSSGRITVRHKGGRVKRKFREIDFKRDKYNVEARVESIEYDPNRTANIMLLVYTDGEKRYSLAPADINVGDKVTSGEEAPIKTGNSMPLKRVPVGTFVHNVELHKGQGGILGRSAGGSIQVQGANKEYMQLKMPSGEVRLIRLENYATIGEVGNGDHTNVSLGKAGRKRKMGIRPSVRGVAMSSKHPHGGGQGKGGRHGPGGPAKDRWGNKVGKKTRKNKTTNKYIVHRKTSKNRKKAKRYKTIV